MARHRIVPIFDVKTACVTYVPIIMDLYKVRLEWAMLNLTACCTVVAATPSIRDIVRERCSASASAISATAVSSTTSRAAVTTTLLETSGLCDRGSPTTLLVTARLRDTIPLVTARLGYASACVCAEGRNIELLNGRWGLGDLMRRLSLWILIR